MYVHFAQPKEFRGVASNGDGGARDVDKQVVQVFTNADGRVRKPCGTTVSAVSTVSTASSTTAPHYSTMRCDVVGITLTHLRCSGNQR